MEYWNHNTAYHRWILRHASRARSALDVGCGDGLLLARLAPRCETAAGIDPDDGAANHARERTACFSNVRVIRGDFLSADFGGETFDAVIFAASLHHMDTEAALMKAKELLNAGGALLVVGLARPDGAADWVTEALRVVPAKIGSFLHGEKRGRTAAVPTRDPQMSLGEIRRIAKRVLPGAKIRRGLYYRYLLRWNMK